MNLFHLRYFVTLAEMKHYTKAAEKLCISQPSLSHAISQMEKELGVHLFEKSGRNTTLTRFGVEFYDSAKRTLAFYDEGVASIKREVNGEGLIRLGFVRPLGVDFVPQLAADFLANNPDKHIQFTFHTDVTGRLTEGLSSHKFDLLFCSRPNDDYNFNYVPVKSQKLVLIVPKNHILSSKAHVNLSDTSDFPYVYFDKNSGIRSVVDKMFEDINVKPRIAYETEEDQVIAGLVAKGFGIAVVPYMDLLMKLDIDILEIESPSYKRDFYMVWDDSVYMPPVVKDFLDFVCSSGNL